MMNIRKSHRDDGDRVLDIWRNAVLATHDFLSPTDYAEIANEVREFLPDAPLLLAVDENDRPLGFMLLNDAHMEALFIDPAHHGKGIGRGLVEYALGLSPFLTTDVNEQNEQASAFYLHLGFIKTGRSELDGQGRPYPLLHLECRRQRSI
ncbi:acetyltransferase [Herbaspirillum frisingense]|uniref:acetyltransferase n=1 Tax=Herbaspirillum frisingense TaxID=92645 RepID=UPI001F170F1A|nr:acetyltransferase [Herbaspirillum frisingense]UIN23926.1 acetyltransferase [Herbaspirillum frisingense]